MTLNYIRKKVLGKDGKYYYFKNGKRISNPKIQFGGRLKGNAFRAFITDINTGNFKKICISTLPFKQWEKGHPFKGKNRLLLQITHSDNNMEYYTIESTSHNHCDIISGMSLYNETHKESGYGIEVQHISYDQLWRYYNNQKYNTPVKQGIWNMSHKNKQRNETKEIQMICLEKLRSGNLSTIRSGICRNSMEVPNSTEATHRVGERLPMANYEGISHINIGHKLPRFVPNCFGGRKLKIHIGSRGGKYYIKKGRKVYI